MRLVASDAVKEKIGREHDVEFFEAQEAFAQAEGVWFEDTRARHKTKPPTIWTLSETSLGRLLKIVVIPRKDLGIAILRTAYEPDNDEVRLYEENQ